MAQITRIYGSRSDAEAVVTELKSYRYEAQVIHPDSQAPAQTGGPGNDATPTHGTHDHIEHELRKAGISHAEAKIYAERVHGGGTLVTVNAPFGEGSQAEYIMDGHNPIDSGVARPDYSSRTTELDDPAPFSRALGLKLLINNPAPLSSLFGLATLSKQQNSNTKLSHEAAPLSRSVALRTLSDNPAPLSNTVKLPTLSGNPAPLSSALGVRVLTDEPAPLSKRFGWSTLSSEPAPLSKLLGLPVLLTKD